MLEVSWQLKEAFVQNNLYAFVKLLCPGLDHKDREFLIVMTLLAKFYPKPEFHKEDLVPVLEFTKELQNISLREWIDYREDGFRAFWFAYVNKKLRSQLFAKGASEKEAEQKQPLYFLNWMNANMTNLAAQNQCILKPKEKREEIYKFVLKHCNDMMKEVGFKDANVTANINPYLVDFSDTTIYLVH